MRDKKWTGNSSPLHSLKPPLNQRVFKARAREGAARKARFSMLRWSYAGEPQFWSSSNQWQPARSLSARGLARLPIDGLTELAIRNGGSVGTGMRERLT